MNQFKSYFIGVAIAMAVALGLMWLIGGVEQTKTGAIFFGGWIAGATSMFIKAKLVYKA
jgi:hypothetical protein